ncbi:hypothetical protein [Streptomyces nigrescens]
MRHVVVQTFAASRVENQCQLSHHTVQPRMPALIETVRGVDYGLVAPTG